MGRGPEVRRKPENLPVVAYFVCSRVWDRVRQVSVKFVGTAWLSGGKYSRRFLRGNGGFFYWCPRDKGRIVRKEVNKGT